MIYWLTKCVCLPLGPGPTVNEVPIAPLSMTGTLERFQMMLRCPATHIINHVPADVTIHARRDLKFREAVGRADLNVPDGMGVVWGCGALGYPDVRERVYGPDFMKLAIEWGVSHKIKHFLLGGSADVRAELERMLHESYPGVLIVGAFSPPLFQPTKWILR